MEFMSPFSFEVIRDMVPESHQKVLANIRKTQERAKRKKKEAESKGENEGDDEEFKPVKPKADRYKSFLSFLFCYSRLGKKNNERMKGLYFDNGTEKEKALMKIYYCHT